MTDGAFPNPFDLPTPAGAQGWERMYPYYATFSEDRRATEEEKFWFFDSMHYPEPVYPFDLLMPEHTWVVLSQNTTRVFSIPTAMGLDHRVVNGYVYVSPTAITDPEEIARRATVFGERGGHYFENWQDLYDGWVRKALDVTARLKAITFTPLADLEPLESVQAGNHLSSGYRLYESYNRLLENHQEMDYLHFDMLGLGYGAYLTLLEFCKAAFPSIEDQTVAKMVTGIESLIFRPDEELRRLSKLAVELDLTAAFADSADPDRVLAAIAALPRGQEWLKDYEDTKEQWFWFSTGHGVSHQHPAWMEDLTFPFSAMQGYVQSLLRNESIDRPLAAVRAERDEITSGYRELLPGPAEQASFDELVELARTVYVYVEDHGFYCEHQHFSIFWTKVRELGAVFAAHGFLEDANDIFYLHRWEVYPALWDLETGWGTGSPDRRAYWHREVAERKRIMAALREWTPPPALGTPPDTITESFTIMLWGITQETIERWQTPRDESTSTLAGVAASPGVAEGRARVVLDPVDLGLLEEGEILVCPITNPSWVPVFKRIAGAVSDSGGIMAHAAIVAREYGLPAVVGTGYGTQAIKTGQLVRVDGSRGIVTILEDDPVG
ncbi:MAG: PEP-utilizing protein mobile subunit [Modestobacter sp.]|nr:PEP-utilizing protein mobile subunit [Modestobacter sp.]